MNPCHTNRLRPRDRVASVSPTPSPHASPTSSRRSETLPNPTFNKKENPPIAQSDYKITTLHEVRIFVKSNLYSGERVC